MADIIDFESRRKKGVYLNPNLEYNYTIDGLDYEETFLSNWIDSIISSSKEEEYKRFISSLLDPEMFGYAVSAEVRDEARHLLGMEKVETVR